MLSVRLIVLPSPMKIARAAMVPATFWIRFWAIWIVVGPLSRKTAWAMPVGPASSVSIPSKMLYWISASLLTPFMLRPMAAFAVTEFVMVNPSTATLAALITITGIDPVGFDPTIVDSAGLPEMRPATGWPAWDPLRTTERGMKTFSG